MADMTQPSDLLDYIELHIPEISGPLNWEDLFGNSNPVELEIGCGKGRFIINSATQYPDINYIGIERASPYFRIMKERAAKSNLTNIRLLQDDAAYFIEKFVPDESITAYHLYFPDPWPKKRHRKRRIFNGDFLTRVERTLIPGGTLDIATDFEQYFEEMIERLDASAVMKKMADIPERVKALGESRTNFETKYVAEGRPIYRAGYRKAQ